MNNRDNQPPLGGSRDDDQPLDVEALLRAFPGRLDRLKEASGLSWSGLARTLGVDRKQTRRWSNGAEPRGRLRALPLPLRRPDPRRPGHPPGTGHRAGPHRR